MPRSEYLLDLAKGQLKKIMTARRYAVSEFRHKKPTNGIPVESPLCVRGVGLTDYVGDGRAEGENPRLKFDQPSFNTHCLA
jgi:hypothetical protein